MPAGPAGDVAGTNRDAVCSGSPVARTPRARDHLPRSQARIIQCSRQAMLPANEVNMLDKLPVRRFFAWSSVAAAVLLAGCQPQAADDAAAPASLAATAAERWYGVFMQGAKVGHSVVRTRVVEERGQQLVETTTSSTIETQKGRETVRLHVTATSWETSAGELRRFSRSIDAGAGIQQASGRVEGGRLVIEDAVGGNRTLRLPADCLGFHAWEKLVAASPPAEGETRKFQALDDTFLTIAAQELVGRGRQVTSTPNGERKLRGIQHRVAMPDGTWRSTQLWTDERGTCVKLRDDAMDIEFHAMPREAALSEPTEKLNLLYDTLVRVDPPLADAGRTQWVRYRIAVDRGNAEQMFAPGPAQAVRRIDDRTIELVVRKVTPETRLSEEVGGATFPSESGKPDTTCIEPNHYLAADDPRLAAMARGVAANERDPWRVAIALEKHVHDTIDQFDYSQAFLTAAEVADGRKGDCSEYAVLLAALLRARGIPSRVAVGLVYLENDAAMGYHMWAEAWINDRWVGLDATRPQGGVAADHIKVVTTNLEHGLTDPALAAFGRVLGAKPRIAVVDSRPK